MSWVFLAGGSAYKLKKPIGNHFDWRNAASRREDCEVEVRLNRRLAAAVYHGVVPLTIDSAGKLHLEGQEGEPVDWLVKMRRLPEKLMLDWLIEHRRVKVGDFVRALTVLCRFYRESIAFRISPRQYRRHLTLQFAGSKRELVSPPYGQSDELVRRVHDLLLGYVERWAGLLDARVREGRVVDAHGDLRPEHICLEPEPVIIDCLQFDQRLRILDTASELSFLALECERLGASQLCPTIWSVYAEICEDQPAAHLLRFYQAYHAYLRAMVSVWHLKDEVADRQKWIRRGKDYLEIAESLMSDNS